MKKIIGPAPLYTFLKFCNLSPLEKEVLDCGAGGKYPPLSLFYEHGYKTWGIEIYEEGINKAMKFSKENNMDLKIIEGDMCNIPFDNQSISFAYSYNSIFHMLKKDIEVAVGEIERVLKKDGICYINLLSVEDCGYGEGKELNKGEFMQSEHGHEVIHSYYEDVEADKYFNSFEIIRKEKRIIEQKIDEEDYKFVYIDYIARKKWLINI